MDLDTTGSGYEGRRRMNIYQISCHHFWIDPELTRCEVINREALHPERAIAGSRSAHSSLSNFPKRDDYDDEISILYVCSNCGARCGLSTDGKSLAGSCFVCSYSSLVFFSAQSSTLTLTLHNRLHSSFQLVCETWKFE